ncbi:ATP-binding cassette domain-containing protein [Agrobacterium tumefaciens]|uniref:branched-chain amino acid ABC transporter ATP-binding protein/permease n=1 Tax=Agrobacterium tumefaciens TaxID=358 RepID=UPI0012B82BA6|nr:branched-chain amino acid ABC transporter ATP-binding protein/permease [Agrobacterium tumefaciens]MQB08018.1 ATP-binding cassette domain-containing protein [Agrobacterium tumefaciens]
MQDVKADGTSVLSPLSREQFSGIISEARFRQAAGSAILLCGIILIFTLPLSFTSASVEKLVILALINIAAVVGFSIYTGNSGILTVGHVGFFAVGAYTTALLTTPTDIKADALRHLPAFLANAEMGLLPSLSIVAALSLVLGFLTGLPLSRLRDTSAIVSTFGLLVIVNFVLKGATNITNGTKGIYGIPELVSLPIVYVLVFLTILIAFAFKVSRRGLQLRAFQDNEVAATASGISPNRRLLDAWTISAVVLGLCGALFAHVIGAFQPHDFYLTLTFELIAMLVVGGKRSISGAVIGTFIITALVEIVKPVESGLTISNLRLPPIWGLTQILLSLMILLVMYKAPAGIMGSRELTLDWFLSKLPGDRRRPERRSYVTTALPMPSADRQPATLETHSVGIEFGGVRALNDVSIRVDTGKIVGLIGPNGAGKTTLINNLTGVHHPTHGEVTLSGQKIVGWSSGRIARAGLGRTFQNIRLFGEMTVLENVITAALARGHATGGVEAYAMGLLVPFDLTEFADHKSSALPYGAQRKLEIVRALALEPRFLLLDEPAAGMNPKETESLIEAILSVRQQFGLGILIVEHDLHLIMRLCDEVFVLNKGELIASGSAEKVQNDPKVIEAYLGSQEVREARRKKT